MQERRRFALIVLVFDVVPGCAEELDVGANFVVGGAAGCGSNDEAAWKSAARFANEPAETRTIFRAVNFPRDADVVNRRHVDEEAARESDVAGDTRALLAEGFLGDLDDDFLTGFQHFGN